jgi:signal transduction histidine kinase/DNA-binding response OmpR family regulator
MLKLSFRTQVLTGFILSLLLVIGVFYFSYTSINNLQKNEKAVDHTEAVIKAANRVQALLLDAETGQRGYIATDQTVFLEPYVKSLSRVPGALIELKALTKDNSDQKSNIDSLVAFANLKSDELRYVIEVSRTRGFDAARTVLAIVPGKYDMDKVRFYVGRIVDVENRRLAIRKASADNAAWNTINGIVVGGVIVVYVVFFLAFYIRSAFRKLRKSEENLRLTNIELETTNEELITKTELLQQSDEELRAQQEDLQNSNTELEEKANLLAEKNESLEEARRAIALKVRELELADKYKSEFLANMSHELRTPLNSILVLAQVLQDNKPGNLTTDQMKYAGVIVNAGNDLLALINDILDLSKIESGKLEIQNENVKISEILYNAEMLFTEIAAKKKIIFTINIDKKLPPQIFTDQLRVEQILKNLLSNAFKFTADGGAVTVNTFAGENNMVIFNVTDTGIGIPEDKQKLIFGAFQQADGSTSRKYGGTGLGLPISRELVTLLGGKIGLTSQPGKGSTFTLTIPLKAESAPVKKDTIFEVEPGRPTYRDVKSGRQRIRENNSEPVVIIVEDDKNFAGILQDYAHEYGYRSVVLNDGTGAFDTIREKMPDAVILDIMLPGKDGWQILKELKRTEETVGIPVHLMSAGEMAVNHVTTEGAINFIKKPTDIHTLDKLFTDLMAGSEISIKQVLLIEDNETQSKVLKELMNGRGITVNQAFDGESALRMLHTAEYQCVILDFNLPDISGLDLLDKIKENDRFKNLPVIINTAMELDKNMVSRLMRYANAMVLKTNKSSNRLIDEVNLFLSKVTESSRNGGLTREGAATSKNNDAIAGKRILIVDDDMRNVFALSSALENFGLKIEIANDGREAINKLEELANFDMVLIDIMMPNMDGYEATRYIRQQHKWVKLPIIALTAKAMVGDREKCIAAGANDYITKPVDMDRLISLLKVWMAN